MNPKIQIIIDPKTGIVEYEIEGIMGERCTDLTAVLARGHTIEDEQLTEDYYVPAESPAYINDL